MSLWLVVVVVITTAVAVVTVGAVVVVATGADAVKECKLSLTTTDSTLLEQNHMKPQG
jgi:hypothetical protein